MPTQLTSPDYRVIRGFTIIEVMIVVAIVAILASIAVPGYQNYIRKSHARAAGGDLVALGLVMENIYQRQLRYPTPTSTNPTTSTDQTKTYVQGGAAVSPWQPAEADEFKYTLAITNGNAGYTLTATGKANTLNSGCELTLTHTNSRQSNEHSGCGGVGDSW